MRLALHVIAKDEKDQLERIINDYGQFFDEIVIAVDEDIDIHQDSKVKLHNYKWKNDFSDKRNFLADKTESEYYFRLDTDDVINNPENIRAVFDNVVKNKIDIVYMEYLYAKDKDGNCVAKHWRETIVRKDSNFSWKAPVHESVVVKDTSKFIGVKEKRVSILHDTDDNHSERSAMRNFKILLEDFNKDKENTDPRTLSYLGRMLLGVGKYEKAKAFLELLVQKSGWDEDKYFALCEIGHCWAQLGNLKRAVACCQEALSINVDYPDAYLELSQIYVEFKDYDKAIHWGLLGLQKKEPDTLYVLDPSKYSYRALMNLAIALFHKGDYKTAKQYYDKASEIAPNEDFIKNNRDLFTEAYNNDEFMRNYLTAFKFINKNDPKKCVDFVKAIPSQLMKDERVISLRNEILPAKTWGDNEIVIHCGASWEDWAAPSVIRGIGGSEEAVIYISKELVKLGWKVTVFNQCGDLEGDYEGVTYKSFFEFNPRDEHNIIISWRANMFVNDVKAKKKIVWLHDVPINQLGEGEEDTFDKILVLSEFHKSLLPKNIPEEKIVVSSNGINTQDFMTNGVARNPKRMIYTSSYDRGIVHLLKMWSDIKKEVPDAELHLFYGWETYDRMVYKGVRDIEFKRSMVSAMNQEGIFEHGRVGHKKLIKEFQKSGLYVYPSHFQEISCISAMKAQGCGCVPVVTDYAALNETVKQGIKVSGKCGNPEVDERFKTELISILNDEQRQEDLRKSVKENKFEFGWDKVAEQWSALFNG